MHGIASCRPGFARRVEIGAQIARELGQRFSIRFGRSRCNEKPVKLSAQIVKFIAWQTLESLAQAHVSDGLANRLVKRCGANGVPKGGQGIQRFCNNAFLSGN
ncbi:MAG: hypothetical protein DME36_05390 [Verrucomicrobia bacterium]|nr:MAG: hypothetical protein DME36_05390 [Verrucomicrobiota bacterium]